MSGFQTSTDRLALTLTTEASVGLLETKKWADHFQEKVSKDDINTEEGIAAATAALDGPDNETIVESTPGQSMEEIEAKMNEEKAKQEAADAEAIQQMTESTKLNLSNPLGRSVLDLCRRELNNGNRFNTGNFRELKLIFEAH